MSPPDKRLRLCEALAETVPHMGLGRVLRTRRDPLRSTIVQSMVPATGHIMAPSAASLSLASATLLLNCSIHRQTPPFIGLPVGVRRLGADFQKLRELLPLRAARSKCLQVGFLADFEQSGRISPAPCVNTRSRVCENT
jgi:hypothetical protein